MLYSESVDHEVREYGVRVVLVEPGPTSTTFDAAMVRPDVLIPAYARQRETFAEVMADSTSNGDDPATVAKIDSQRSPTPNQGSDTPPASRPVE